VFCVALGIGMFFWGRRLIPLIETSSIAQKGGR
jgi:hypothetical protein